MDNKNLHKPTMRVLEILEAVYHSENGLTLTDISRSTGIFKGTLHPIVNTLLQKEYLESRSQRFHIGRNCFKLGYSYVNTLSYLNIIKPDMKEIVETCGEICQLGILDGTDVLYVEKIDPKQAVRITSSVGSTLKAYATSLGKCLLSGLSDEAIRQLYPDGLESYTANTVPDLDALLSQAQQVRQQGFIYERGETNIDIECVGVPIKVNHTVLAAMSVSLPSFRSTPEKIEEITKLLKEHAIKIEHTLSTLPSGLEMFPL
jgi:IclR family KDG regulon transcriptional repressor